MDLFGIWGRAADDILAVGAAGTILHFDGNTWSVQDSPTDRTLLGIAGNQDIAIAVGEDGIVLKDEGDGWFSSPSGTNRDLHDAWFGSDGVWYAVGDNGTLITH